tara:strand:- start:77 stop:301 length:225 start_codon:yes stop_codon:yes gene_type:complete
MSNLKILLPYSSIFWVAEKSGVYIFGIFIYIFIYIFPIHYSSNSSTRKKTLKNNFVEKSVKDVLFNFNYCVPLT